MITILKTILDLLLWFTSKFVLLTAKVRGELGAGHVIDGVAVEPLPRVSVQGRDLRTVTIEQRVVRTTNRYAASYVWM